MKKTDFSAFALDAKALKQVKGGEDTNDAAAMAALLITDPMRKKERRT